MLGRVMVGTGSGLPDIGSSRGRDGPGASISCIEVTQWRGGSIHVLHRPGPLGIATLKPMFGVLKGILVSDRAGALNLGNEAAPDLLSAFA